MIEGVLDPELADRIGRPERGRHGKGGGTPQQAGKATQESPGAAETRLAELAAGDVGSGEAGPGSHPRR